MSLSDRLKQALAAHPDGLTQLGLAIACGVKPPSVHGWVSGKTKSMQADYLYPAAAYLGVRPIWLAMGKGPMRGPDLAMEGTATYEAWPIKAISRKEYVQLPARLREKIEDYVALIARDQASHRDDTRQSAS